MSIREQERAEMKLRFINPRTGRPLVEQGAALLSDGEHCYEIINEIPRFVSTEGNYVDNFGFQWRKFSRTQLDSATSSQSSRRFFLETGWTPETLTDATILEAGSGAGRFSRVILEETDAKLFSFDYSAAVDANWESNRSICPKRFTLFQASIYEIPFPSCTFDKVFCFGVLQHTPDFEKSVKSLINQAKIGGEIVVDFYERRGPWTKISAKYMLRPLSKKIGHKPLLDLISRNIGWLINASDLMRRVGLGPLTRFLPIVDLRTLPQTLTKDERREWAILDTFDMFSPEYDNPQTIKDVAAMFERNGARVTFAGRIEGAAVVRGVRVE